MEGGHVAPPLNPPRLPFGGHMTSSVHAIVQGYNGHFVALITKHPGPMQDQINAMYRFYYIVLLFNMTSTYLYVLLYRF